MAKNIPIKPAKEVKIPNLIYAKNKSVLDFIVDGNELKNENSLLEVCAFLENSLSV